MEIYYIKTMKNKLKPFLIMIILTIGLIGVIVLFTKNIHREQEKEADTIYDFAMGTSVSIKLYGADDENAMAEDIVAGINNLSDNLISWRADTSELYNLNKSYRAGEEYLLSEELNEILVMSYKICEDSKGALDITIRPLANLWGIEELNEDTFSLPDFLEVSEVVKQIGYEKLTLTDSGVILDDEDMIIDFGATGKGYALDVVRRDFLKDKVKGAVISIGGSVLVYGEKTDNKPWNIGIRDPFAADGNMMGYLEFYDNTDICISTSGDYEKYIEKDGVRYHHIFDRETGYPADSGLVSVTIICENGLTSDGLSTACFVLGYDESLKLIEKYNAEAIFVFEDGSVIATEGIKDNFKLAE